MEKTFHPFFLECSFCEQDMARKKFFSKMAFNNGGGLIFVRGGHSYLSLEGNMEFKVPKEYDQAEHAKLIAMIQSSSQKNSSRYLKNDKP